MTKAQISHYEIVEKLGDGGMGTVYKARDLRLLRFVAIKLLRPELMIDEKKRVRFIREAQTASSLNHPNICTIHDINEDDNQHFIVMELVEGKTLRQILEQRNSLPESELIEISIKICEALSAVHEKGISHRDIKPENIMITDNGLIKVMDFGLAKLATEYSESFMEIQGNQGWNINYTENVVVSNLSGLLGTVHYMSPEQARGEKIDHRSDIFSLGVMLIELLTGKKPFQGETNLDILTKIIEESPEFDELSEENSSEFIRIISRTLNKNAEDRYQSIKELLSDIKELRKDELSTINKDNNIKSSGFYRTNRKVILILSAVVTLVLVFWVLSLKLNPAREDYLATMQTSRFTSYPGMEASPVISPDGKSIAFSWNGPEQNNLDIYVKRRDGGDPVRMTTSPDPDYNPEWSHDGRYLAFIRPYPDKPRAYDIFILPSEGGREKRIYTINPMGTKPLLSWSKDNSSVYFSKWAPQDSSAAVFKVSVESGQIEQVTSPIKEIVGDFSPRISPDGKYLGFIRRRLGDHYDITIMNLKTNKIQKVTNESVRLAGFSWGNDSRSIIYSANLDGTSALWKTDISGKRKEKILSGINVSNPHYSPAGKCIVYNEKITNSNIWKIDFQHPEHEVLLISSSTLDNMNPDISQDGKRIVFSSNRTGTHNIWTCNSDGTEPRQLTFFNKKVNAGSAQWSPTDDELLIDFNENLFYVMNVSTGELLEFENLGIRPIWDQNGQGFYVSSYPETNLYFVSRDGKTKRKITKDIGLFAKTLGDELYYFKHYDIREIWSISIEEGPEEPVLQGMRLGITSWDVFSKGIYFYRWNNGSQVLYLYDFESREIKEIKSIPGARGSIAIDPDGQYLLYSKMESNWNDIILVENVNIE